MREMAPIVTENGDIQMHGREGALIVLSFQEDDGTPRDMTSAVVTFEVRGFTKPLVVGDQPHLMNLTLNRGELPTAFLGKVEDFVVLDETGAIPHVIWSGKVILTGWL